MFSLKKCFTNAREQVAKPNVNKTTAGTVAMPKNTARTPKTPSDTAITDLINEIK
jgi:hypothetical protein